MPLPGEFDPDKVIIQAASISPDAKAVKALVIDALKLVHADSDWQIGPAEPSFGWNFYALSINRGTVRRLAQLPDSEIAKTKGETLEQKFVNWRNRRAKKSVGDGVHFALISDLKSSRYGLF